ncbi:MAG: FAD synthase [Candidatus Bathyarchaeota archaeon]|nr:FAD synthase [Candidatus Bathyarchaeota archaeon]
MADKKTTIVLASGVFDLLHLGHVKYLEEAKAAGGKNAKLTVIVARDSTVEKLKGRKPIMSEDERCALVKALRIVDEAVLGAEHFDMAEVIDLVKPDVIALGYDQEDILRQVQNYVTANKSGIKVVRVGKFGQNTLDSSSKIKEKIIEKSKR